MEGDGDDDMMTIIMHGWYFKDSIKFKELDSCLVHDVLYMYVHVQRTTYNIQRTTVCIQRTTTTITTDNSFTDDDRSLHQFPAAAHGHA